MANIKLLISTLAVAAAGSDSKSSLLTNLPLEYAAVKWRTLQSEKSFHVFTKELAGTQENGDSRPAVVKVLARARLPVRALLDTFLSEDAQVVSQWNPFAGEVMHLDKAVQLQTYSLPWPFSAREYLVRCDDVRGGKAALQAHCRSIDGHPSAPERADRVRGRSETVWRFTEDNDGQTSIHLETLVDPKGGLPTWLVDKAGTSAAVKIVRALIRYTGSKHIARGGEHKQHAANWRKRSGARQHSAQPAAAVGVPNVCDASPADVGAEDHEQLLLSRATAECSSRHSGGSSVWSAVMAKGWSLFGSSS